MSIRAFLPGLLISLSGFLTSTYCDPLVNSGINVPGRPPAWVFGVVWPILYITTGIAWALSKRDAYFATVVALACMWLFVYSCKKDKTSAALLLVLNAIISWKMVSTMSGDIKKLFLPWAVWISFATYLNTYSVLHSDS